MDAATGGVNFKIAEKLGLKNLKFFAGEKEVDGVKGGEGVIGEVPYYKRRYVGANRVIKSPANKK